MQTCSWPTGSLALAPHLAAVPRQPVSCRLHTHLRHPIILSNGSQQLSTSHDLDRKCGSVQFQPQLRQQHSTAADVSFRQMDMFANSSSSSSSNRGQVSNVGGSNSSSDSESDSAAAVMVCFLSAYGLQPQDIQRLLQECPQLFEDSSSTSSNSSGAFGAAGSCTAGWSPYSYEEEAAAQEAAVAAAADVPAPATSVYEVGRTLLFFHSLGWSHISVMRRIVGLYPQLLTKQVDRDIVPVLEALTAMGCTDANIQLLVWEFPRIFCSSNWRRHIRKFQYLGLYGLPPPGQSGSSNSSTADRLERLLQWY